MSNHNGFIHVNKHTKDFDKIIKLFDHLHFSSILHMSSGYCVGSCEVIRLALHNIGIKSNMVEVTLLLQNKHTDYYIGVEKEITNGQVDSHVVLITDTDPPYLIDPSIKFGLEQDKSFIIIEIDKNKNFRNDEPFTVKFNDELSTTYILKTRQKIPLSVQQSILHRIDTDKKLFDKINFLKKVIFAALLISVLNSIRGAYDYYQVYIDSDNYWGPKHIKELHEKVDALNKKYDDSNTQNKK